MGFMGEQQHTETVLLYANSKNLEKKTVFFRIPSKQKLGRKFNHGNERVVQRTYRTLVKEIEEDKQMGRYPVFVDRKD